MNTDNRQETGLIGWLAGIVDGEGAICLTVSQRHGRRITIRVTPRIVIANTDAAIIERCVEALNVIGVGRYVRHERRPPRAICGHSKKSTFKQVTTIEVTGFKRVRRMLEAIQPYLAPTGTKAIRAERLLAFLIGRMTFADDRKSAQNLVYRQKDVDRILAFLRLTKVRDFDHVARILNEHTRDSRHMDVPRRQREKMCSGLMGDHERSSEMATRR